MILVTVTSQNGNKKTYKIIVTKTDTAYLSNSYLENLAIENVFLLPEFRFDVFEYTAEIGSNIESLNILAVPQIEGATVSITGAENLAYGSNKINITTTSKDKSKTSTYIVDVYKKTENEETMELLENTNANVEKNLQTDDINENIQPKIDVNKIVTVIIIGLGILVLIGMLIWIYYKEKNMQK